MTLATTAGGRCTVTESREPHCGCAGTHVHSRELILDNFGIVVSKPRRPLRTREDATDNSRLVPMSRDGIDHRLARLYQGTFDAPIPQDMLRLIEKIGALQSHKQ